MEYPRYFAELVAALVAMVTLAIIVALLLRTYKIPECFSCGARKVRPTHSIGFWDTLGTAFLIRPYRCGGCRERFYGFRRSDDAKKPPAQLSLHPQQVVKVTVGFRHGLPKRVAIRLIDMGRDKGAPTPGPISDLPAISQI
jgi:hypothetical protein